MAIYLSAITALVSLCLWHLTTAHNVAKGSAIINCFPNYAEEAFNASACWDAIVNYGETTAVDDRYKLCSGCAFGVMGGFDDTDWPHCLALTYNHEERGMVTVEKQDALLQMKAIYKQCMEPWNMNGFATYANPDHGMPTINVTYIGDRPSRHQPPPSGVPSMVQSGGIHMSYRLSIGPDAAGGGVHQLNDDFPQAYCKGIPQNGTGLNADDCFEVVSTFAASSIDADLSIAAGSCATQTVKTCSVSLCNRQEKAVLIVDKLWLNETVRSLAWTCIPADGLEGVWSDDKQELRLYSGN